MITRKQRAVWVTSAGTEFAERADAVEAETREVLTKVLAEQATDGFMLESRTPADIARHLLRSPLLHIMTISGAKNDRP